MFRIGLICACLAGLTACVATPSAPTSFIGGSQSLPASQVELRRQAEELDHRFHEAGWVSEDHGAAIMRLTGMLMNGRDDNDRPRRLDVYYEAAGLETADAVRIIEVARADLAQATHLVLAIVGAGEAVLAEPGVTPRTLSADIAALEQVIGESSQALALFELVNEDAAEGGDLGEAIGALAQAVEHVGVTADAMASRRRTLRTSATG
ncbi:hypothetical protein V0U79_07775 [Hyphobacterium sp. HN65]|uniref:Uncharacterized protein n=1 Tax=Hyphobacterium lacteum TaxID=3116575 RepID=A0ABU7LQS9_9PROT|nr:hypothetical protein [Hyphobacterium sp. HN65]MEE2526262.1 hypothetical protein [Hyphobacterium sp. HN65]